MCKESNPYNRNGYRSSAIRIPCLLSYVFNPSSVSPSGDVNLAKLPLLICYRLTVLQVFISSNGFLESAKVKIWVIYFKDDVQVVD